MKPKTSNFIRYRGKSGVLKEKEIQNTGNLDRNFRSFQWENWGWQGKSGLYMDYFEIGAFGFAWKKPEFADLRPGKKVNWDYWEKDGK